MTIKRLLARGYAPGIRAGWRVAPTFDWPIRRTAIISLSKSRVRTFLSLYFAYRVLPFTVGIGTSSSKMRVRLTSVCWRKSHSEPILRLAKVVPNLLTASGIMAGAGLEHASRGFPVLLGDLAN